MTDPESTREVDPPSSVARGVAPELQSAMEQILAMLPGAGGGHDPTGQINALGQLMDPEVRHRLLAAIEEMRSAGLAAADRQGAGPAILDLRGTPAGEALRASVLQFTAKSGAIRGLESAQIIFDEAGPGAIAAPPARVEVPAAPTPEAGVAPVVTSHSHRETPALRQPTLVEDAGSGGFLGWLSRILNGREA